MTTNIKIQKDVPMPNKGSGETMRKYPFKFMEVGDSFAMDAQSNTVNKISAAMISAGRSQGKKFSLRTVFEDGKKVIRVWRIE